MNVLIVGTGAREHALTWKVLQSPLSRAVFCAPGNAATGAIAVNVPVPTTDVDGIARLAHEREIDLTIVGPEGAVAAGVVDRLTSVGRLALGPTAAAGRIESSKVFAKTLMQKVGVPTPAFAVFTEASAAKAYVQKQGRPFVVKADGLAKGKGSIVPDDIPETLEAIDTFMLLASHRLASSRNRGPQELDELDEQIEKVKHYCMRLHELERDRTGEAAYDSKIIDAVEEVLVACREATKVISAQRKAN